MKRIVEDALRLVTGNSDFIKLEAQLSSFNPFKVLRIERYEIHHSNFLAWLFSPLESHSLDDIILKLFLSKVLLSQKNSMLAKSAEWALGFHKSGLMDARVRIEYKNVDILITSESLKTVILIENKVFSSESEGQTERYLNLIKAEFSKKGYEVIPIFLTLEGDEAGDPEYFSASYLELLDVLNFVVEHYKDKASSDILTFIEYYIEILEEKYAMNEEIAQACKDLYRNHREVFDLVFEYGKERMLIAAANKFFCQNEDLLPGSQSGKNAQEQFAAFKSVELGIEPPFKSEHDIWMRFTHHKGNEELRLFMIAWKFEDEQKWEAFLEKLSSRGTNVGNIETVLQDRSKKSYRLYSERIGGIDWDNIDSVLKGMETLYESPELMELRSLVEEALKA